MTDRPEKLDKEIGYSELIDVIERAITNESIKSASYLGVLWIDIMKSLCKLPNENVHVIDFNNRWGNESQYDWDSGDKLRDSWIPDWMEGINFYSEGCKRCELTIIEHHLLDSNKINSLASKAKILVLLRFNLKHAEELNRFKWEKFDGFVVGYLKSDFV